MVLNLLSVNNMKIRGFLLTVTRTYHLTKERILVDVIWLINTSLSVAEIVIA